MTFFRIYRVICLGRGDKLSATKPVLTRLGNAQKKGFPNLTLTWFKPG